MKKTIKILFLYLFSLIIISMLYSVNAASASISASKTSATVGDSVSINVSIYAAAWNVSVSGSGISDTITGYNDDAVNTSKSKSYTLNTSTAGTYTVSISGDITDETSDFSSPVSKSVTITVSNPTPPPSSTNNSGNSSSNSSSSTSSNNKPATPKPEEKKSSDAKLNSLSVAEGTISPEFSSSTKEYTLTVPNEVTQVSVTGTVNHSKATYSVEGNKELQVGENTVKFIVRAEDGTTSTYTIIVTRERAALSLQSLVVSFADENGVIKELVLTPAFSFDITEYTMDKLAYTVSNLNVEALANLEGAEVKIEGNDNLVEGENKIIITITMPAETSPETGEVIREEEIKTYTITVEKEAAPVIVPPTFWQQAGTWFSGTFGDIGIWIENNAATILMFCSILLFGLSIYLVIDYKKYKTLLAKLKQLTDMNSVNEPVSENSTINENHDNIDNPEIIEEENNETNEQKKKIGRHF